MPSIKGGDNDDLDVSVKPSVVVLVVIPDWTQPYLAYLIDKELPEDKVLRRQVVRRAKAYTVIKCQLYKRSTTGVFQLCISPEESRQILQEIHSGDCGHQA